jgi:hypothetical protein
MIYLYIGAAIFVAGLFAFVIWIFIQIQRDVKEFNAERAKMRERMAKVRGRMDKYHD